MVDDYFVFSGVSLQLEAYGSEFPQLGEIAWCIDQPTSWYRLPLQFRCFENEELLLRE